MSYRTILGLDGEAGMGGWQGMGVSLILNLIQMASEGGLFEDYLIHLLTGLF